MSIETLRALQVTCDWPGCDAEELLDGSHAVVRKRLRDLGWGVSGSVGSRGVTVRCPGHRSWHLHRGVAPRNRSA